MRRVAAWILALSALSLLPGVAVASDNTVGVKLTGPGMTKPGKAITADFSVVNRSDSSATLPDAISEIRIDTSDLRIRPSAVAICRPKKPRDGDSIGCSSASRVGGGQIRGFLGQPDGSTKEFGSLSVVSGRVSLFNLAPRRGKARVAVEVTSARPFRGVVFSLTAAVNAKNELVVRVPKLAELPRVVRRSYPKDTKLILTRVGLKVSGGTKQARRPYLSLKTIGSGGLGTKVSFAE